MGPAILGEHPLARDERGNLRSRIATLFLRGGVLVTLPGIHATQRLAYTEFLNQERASKGLKSLTGEEELEEWDQSVDLIMENDTILIRPDPENMVAAFAADEILQQLVSKHKIRFLNVMDESVRQAIKERGECWRISPLPQSPEEMERMIREARIGIGGRAIYYYSLITGTRFLTFDEFTRLGALEPQALARHLNEIREYSGRNNRRHYREVDFFGTEGSFGHESFGTTDFSQVDPHQLTTRYEEIRTAFRDSVSPELREDDPKNLEWRNRIFSALLGKRDETVADVILRGLSPEFFMQIQWLPGGRIEDGEFIFDSIFDELGKQPGNEDLAALCDEKAKGFIFNLIRDFGDVEYVNVGRVARSLSRRPEAAGRRGVYIAEIKQRDLGEPVARVIRLQKWDIVDHLEEGTDILGAIMEAEEYTEYVLDRRLGCRQLGMSLPTSVTTRRIYQPYRGSRHEYEGQMIWFTYFERDYVGGVATDKIAAPKYRSNEFAIRFARLLGAAAAPSLIVGKADLNGKALFDDGDEVLVMDIDGMPIAIVTSDPTGTFVNYLNSFEESARDYARPASSRLALVPDPSAFAEAYLKAFAEHFMHIQQNYRDRKKGFEALFKHRKRDEGGSFAYRWEKVLERLERADARALAEHIQDCLKLERTAQLPCSPLGTAERTITS